MSNEQRSHRVRHDRDVVQWRKQSYGTQSIEGSLFVERILTTVHTLRAQGRDLWGYLSSTATTFLRGLSVPSLLPAPDPGR